MVILENCHFVKKNKKTKTQTKTSILWVENGPKHHPKPEPFKAHADVEWTVWYITTSWSSRFLIFPPPPAPSPSSRIQRNHTYFQMLTETPRGITILHFAGCTAKWQMAIFESLLESIFLVCNVADGKNRPFYLWLTIIIIKAEHIAVNMKILLTEELKHFPEM